MPRILAIEPDPSVTRPSLPADLTGHDLVRVGSLDEALASIEHRAPDLIVFPLALTAAEEDTLKSAIAPAARTDDLDTLIAPLDAALARATWPDRPPMTARWYFWFRPAAGPFSAAACTEGALADAIRGRLAMHLAHGLDLDAEFDVEPGTLEGETILTGASGAAGATGASGATGEAGASGEPAEERVSPWRRVGGAATGAFGLLRRLPSTLKRPQQRPVPNRFGVPAEMLIKLRRARTRKYTAMAATLAVAVPVGVTWRSEILTVAAELGVMEHAPAEIAEASAEPVPSSGTLELTSNVDNTRVLVGGKERGTAPLVIEKLPPGSYKITFESPSGVVSRNAVVKEGQTSTVEAGIYPGWVAVFAPFELRVSERGRRLTLDEQNRVMLSPGRHELELANTDLGFRDVRIVEITPGETTAASLTPARTTLSVTTTAGAEVWLDGALIGPAPVADVPVNLGIHEVVVRHPSLGERRRTLTATAKPVSIDVDLTQPGR